MQRAIVGLSNHSLETLPIAASLMHAQDVILLEEPVEETFLPMLETDISFPTMVYETII